MDGMLLPQLSRPKITVTGRGPPYPGETCDLRDSGRRAAKAGCAGPYKLGEQGSALTSRPDETRDARARASVAQPQTRGRAAAAARAPAAGPNPDRRTSERPALRRRTGLQAPAERVASFHVTAGPRDSCRRDPSRSLVPEDVPVPACFRLPPASWIPLLSSPSAVPAFVPGRYLRVLEPAIVCLLQAPNKVSSSGVFFKPTSSLSRLLPRASTASPAAGETRALESGARSPVMAGPPGVSVGSGQVRVAFLGHFLGSFFLLPAPAESWASWGTCGYRGREAEARAGGACSSAGQRAPRAAGLRFHGGHGPVSNGSRGGEGQAAARRAPGSDCLCSFLLRCDSWLFACLHGNGLQIPTEIPRLPLPLHMVQGCWLPCINLYRTVNASLKWFDTVIINIFNSPMTVMSVLCPLSEVLQRDSIFNNKPTF